MIVTAPEMLYPERWARILDAHPAMREIEGDLEGPARRVQQWCDANAVPCVRLSSTFLVHRARTPTPVRIRRTLDDGWPCAGGRDGGSGVAAQSIL